MPTPQPVKPQAPPKEPKTETNEEVIVVARGSRPVAMFGRARRLGKSKGFRQLSRKVQRFIAGRLNRCSDDLLIQSITSLVEAEPFGALSLDVQTALVSEVCSNPQTRGLLISAANDQAFVQLEVAEQRELLALLSGPNLEDLRMKRLWEGLRRAATVLFRQRPRAGVRRVNNDIDSVERIVDYLFTSTCDIWFVHAPDGSGAVSCGDPRRPDSPSFGMCWARNQRSVHAELQRPAKVLLALSSPAHRDRLPGLAYAKYQVSRLDLFRFITWIESNYLFASGTMPHRGKLLNPGNIEFVARAREMLGQIVSAQSSVPVETGDNLQKSAPGHPTVRPQRNNVAPFPQPNTVPAPA